MRSALLAAALLVPTAVQAAEASLAVFPLVAKPGVEGAVADLMTLRLVEELRATTLLVVRSPDETATLLSPTERKILIDCATDRCAVVDTEIAGALGVTHILVGSLFAVKAGLLVNLKAIDVRTALEVASMSRTLDGAGTDAVLRETPALIAGLVTQAAFPRRPVPAPPPVTPAALAPVTTEKRPAGWLRPLAGLGLVAGAPMLLTALAAAALGAGMLAVVVLPWIPSFALFPRVVKGGDEREGALLVAGGSLVGGGALLAAVSLLAAGAAASLLAASLAGGP